jgi:glutaredoxin
MNTAKPKIIAYLKPHCGWSQGVRAVLRKYALEFEDRDIWNDPMQRLEMIQKSGQELSPCVEIQGQMLADVSGEEVERWMIANGVVQPSDQDPGVPTNAPCPDHAPQPVTMTLRS